ncbi:hypothetical protein [Ponticoccus litoralis]|uniref:GST C-terminal domain-containing protein n=1 Tax=Ponticoccus litoralis TaxID=422297 RepID=A0AAW9SRT6_9RHOB
MKWPSPRAKLRLPGVNERINERLQEASDRLGTAEWFGGSFSAGDLMMVSVLRIIEGEGLVEAFPNLAAYVARASERTGLQTGPVRSACRLHGQSAARFR